VTGRFWPTTNRRGRRVAGSQGRAGAGIGQNRPDPSKVTKIIERHDSQPDPISYYIHNRFEVRYVSANGGIRWNRDWVNVSNMCIGEYVGLEEIGDGIWNVYFGPSKVCRINERHMRIEDQDGRLKRKTVQPVFPNTFVKHLPCRSAERGRYTAEVRV
jgi:hypothetical protein